MTGNLTRIWLILVFIHAASSHFVHSNPDKNAPGSQFQRASNAPKTARFGHEMSALRVTITVQ